MQRTIEITTRAVVTVTVPDDDEIFSIPEIDREEVSQEIAKHFQAYGPGEFYGVVECGINEPGSTVICSHLSNETDARTVQESAEAKPEAFGFELDGRVYDRAQIISALRCAEGLSTAYANANEDLGLGSRSIEWEDIDAANRHGAAALSDGQRDRIDAQCVAQFHGVQTNGNGIVLQTDDTGDELEVTSANIPDEHMQLLLNASGQLHVRNQDGLDLIIYFDMDQESIVVEIDSNDSGSLPTAEG